MSNTSVACPGEAVLFTCFKPTTALRWQADPPVESGLMSVQSAIFLGSIVGQGDTFGSGVIMFEAVLVILPPLLVGCLSAMSSPSLQVTSHRGDHLGTDNHLL